MLTSIIRGGGAGAAGARVHTSNTSATISIYVYRIDIIAQRCHAAAQRGSEAVARAVGVSRSQRAHLAQLTWQLAAELESAAL
jgi:hypothetical protein